MRLGLERPKFSATETSRSVERSNAGGARLFDFLLGDRGALLLAWEAVFACFGLATDRLVGDTDMRVFWVDVGQIKSSLDEIEKAWSI